jgi:hypothetical protein
MRVNGWYSVLKFTACGTYLRATVEGRDLSGQRDGSSKTASIEDPWAIRRMGEYLIEQAEKIEARQTKARAKAKKGAKR